MRRWRDIAASFQVGSAGRIIVYGVLVGLMTGFAAVAFFYGLEWFTHLCMVEGAQVPLLVPEGEELFSEQPAGPPRRWLFFLLPALGGLVSGLIVYTFAPEAEGHGTDAMIDAFHRKRGIIRPRVPFLKAIATIATLGTGGSAGREGPIAQIGAGFGSWLAQRLRLTVRERRALMLAGTAGGLGAIFRAPLGGALTSIEVIYREDFEAEALLPAIVSSVTAYAVFSSMFGYERIFAIPPFRFSNPWELLVYAVLGLLCIPVGILYIKVFYGTRDRVFRPLPLPRHLKPMVGGIGVGLLGLALPEVYGSGWGQIQLALSGQLPWHLMLALVGAKMLATALTIGSGGSGGVFGPTLFIGGMLGGAVGLAGQALFPELVLQPGAYVLVGMAAFFAGVASAPLGVLLMVCEMTGGYDLIAPLLLVSAIALVFTRRWSIYEKQAKDRFHSEAHMADLAVNVLETIPVSAVLVPDEPVAVLSTHQRLGDIRELVTETAQNSFPVRDRSGTLVGMLGVAKARPILFEEDLDQVLIVADLMDPLVTVRPDDSLGTVQRLLGETGGQELPVLHPRDPSRIVGLVRHDQVTAAYQARLKQMRASEEEAG